MHWCASMKTTLPIARSDSWLVVWTESRAEKKVASRVAAEGFEPWLPTIAERHRWSDRWREVILPLFPGYLFVRSSQTQLHHILRIPGVLTIVKSGARPAQVSDSFVVSLRQALECTGMVATPVDTPAVRHDYDLDEEVIVQEGPLAGLRGVVQQLRGGRQLVIWVREIGRGVAFSIGAALVARASPRAGIAGIDPR
jgi:transcription antitermination factor NusG